MKKKNRLLARVMALALATTMAFGLSMTAFAANGEPPTGEFEQGASEGAKNSSNAKEGHAYPDDGEGGLGSVQYIDVEKLSPKSGLTGKNTETGTIAVSGLESGLTVTAYQVIEPKYDDNDTFIGWQNVAAKAGDDKFDLVNGNVVDMDKFNRDGINYMASHTAGLTSKPMNDEGNGRYVNNAVAPGTYVLVVSGSEARTYGAMVVSLYYTAKETLQGTELKLTANMAVAKMQDEPNIDKAITHLESQDNRFSGDVSADGRGKGETAVVNVGDTVWFDIRVNNIPEYHGSNPVFTVYDYMDTNLEFIESSVQYGVMFGADTTHYIGDDNVIKAEYKKSLAPTIDYSTTITKDSVGNSNIPGMSMDNGNRTEISFNFVTGSGFILNDWAGYDLVIRYAAKVVDTTSNDIGYNDDGLATMPNNAVLEFTHNSNLASDDGTDKTDPTGDKTVYTAVIELHKIDAMTKDLIDGAVFDLRIYVSEEAASEMDVEYDDDGDPYIAVMTNIEATNGVLVLKGLAPTPDEDSYYTLVEVTPPTGYSLSEMFYNLTLTILDEQGKVVYTVEDLESNKLGEFNGGAHAAGTHDTATDEDAVFAIPNVKMTDLPTTGGAGTALLIGLGICGAIAACFVIFGTRKKTEEQ